MLKNSSLYDAKNAVANCNILYFDVVTFCGFLTFVLDIAPYFTDTGRMKRKYLLIPAGHDAKIVCSADGSPKPTVTWYKDGKKLKYMPDGFTLLTPNTFIITFNVLKPDHSGKYKCVVSNEFGSISEEYTVKVKGKMPIFLI